MVTPADPANPALQPLIVAGVDKLAIDLDLSAAWTESSGAFSLAPATLDLGNLAKAQVSVALAKVSRDLFTTMDPSEAMGQLAQVEPAQSSSPCATAAWSIWSWRSPRACRMSAAMWRAAPSSR
jgi:hypothetical protein